ncbi:hypothetical protein GGR56DRAFT_409955 [Xylariaceae sp. FL0804]|nr:hypothetical protein GGR56DRAFT_409955 [Xylariaceae sp. FL0804]
MHAAKTAFVAHGVVETAAAFSFILRPESQLSPCTPAARLILRQYGGLLLASSLVCLAVLLEPGFSDTARLLAAALGTYHLWPTYRAYVRIRQQQHHAEHKAAVAVLGGPPVHFFVHALCLVLFALAATAAPA